MALILLFLLAPFVFVVIRTAAGPNEGGNPLWRKTFLALYLAMIMLYGATQLGEKYNYYIRGYRSTSIVFLTMAIAAITYWCIDRRKAFRNIFSGLLFCISFAIISISSFLLAELIGDYRQQLIYNDNRYRLEDTNRTIMGPCGLPALFVKESIYEREYKLDKATADTCFAAADISRVKVDAISVNEVSVSYYFKNTLDNSRSFNALYRIE